MSLFGGYWSITDMLVSAYVVNIGQCQQYGLKGNIKETNGDVY